MRPVLAAALLALCAGVPAQAASPSIDSTRKTMTTQQDASAPGGMFSLSDLKPLLPAKAGIWRQQNFGVKTDDDNGVAGTWVSGNYSAGPKKAKLTITDLGDVAAATTPWTGPPVEGNGQKTYGESGRTVREEEKRGGKREVTFILGNGIAVGASGVNIEMAELKQLAAGIDLARAEKLARPKK